MVSPLVKWVGGKTKLLPELVKRMPPKYRVYYEPFFGGGALFFHVQPLISVISDFNPHLALVYRMVQSDPERVIRSLRRLEVGYRQSSRYRDRLDYYLDRREQWNVPLVSRVPNASRASFFAALFMFLNRTCFNGLWRENAKGEFNVPMGDYPPSHVICDAPRIRAASAALKGAVIRSGDYWKNCSDAKAGDFVYLDPPYAPASSTANFVGYTGDGFDLQAQDLLAYRAVELIEHGARVMLSNADVPYIRSLYRGFKIKGEPVFKLHKVSAPRAINSNGKKRGKVAELIITGGY